MKIYRIEVKPEFRPSIQNFVLSHRRTAAPVGTLASAIVR